MKVTIESNSYKGILDYVREVKGKGYKCIKVGAKGAKKGDLMHIEANITFTKETK